MKIFVWALVMFFVGINNASAEIFAQFTTNVENKEPVDNVKIANKSMESIMFYSNILKEDGNTVYHVWKNGDKEIYKGSFHIKGPRWRVWTSVMTNHFNSGDVAVVEVVDINNNLLGRYELPIK